VLRTPTLHGREPVRARLADGGTSAAAGRARTFLLAGWPGSGKTSLLREAACRARAEGFQVWRLAGVEDEADLPLAALSLLLRPLAGSLAQLTAGLPEGQREALLTAAGLSDDVIVDRFTLGAAVLGLLASAAEHRRLLLAVDDAQWLDAPSAEALSFALRRLAADAVLVVVATRPGQNRLSLPADVEHIDVGGLAEEEVVALLADAGLAVTAPVAAAITEVTGGLPLAVLESARALTAAQRAGQDPLPQPLPIGHDVTAAYASRLRALPRPTRRAVSVAALAGTASFGTLAAALTSLGLSIADLRPAEDAGVLMVAPRKVEFAHPLLRAAAADLATPSECRRHHLALADTAEHDPEQRARHLAAAATGPEEAVATALEVAAAEVTRRAGLAAAAPLLAQAAAFTPLGERRCARLVQAARALHLAGQVNEALRATTDVFEQATAPAARADAAMVMIALTTFGAQRTHALAFAATEAERVLPVDPARATHLLAHAAMSAIGVGELDASVRLAERAYHLLDPTTPGDVRADATSLYAATLVLTGMPDRAKAVLAGWSLPEDLAAAGQLHMLANLAQTFLRLGQYAEAEGLNRVLLEWCDRKATPTAKAFVLATLAELRCWQGQWANAVSLGDLAYALAEQTGQTALSWAIRGTTARILAAQGEQRRSRECAHATLAVPDIEGFPPLRIYSLAALGLLELTSGNPAAAARWLLEADEVRRRVGCRCPAAVPYGADLVEALLRSGQGGAARRALEEHAELSDLPWARAVTLRCRALLTEDPDEANDLFAEAMQRHPAEVPFDAARTQLYWGEHLRRHRDIAASRPLLQGALDIFERLDARLWAERAATELRAAGERPRRARTPDLAELSPRELHCALAVAEGMTNREAAAALLLSPKTVEYHLSKAYTKLGITSRTQLARVLASRH
jgi:DNA-binding CsgD family transcriptional regulator